MKLYLLTLICIFINHQLSAIDYYWVGGNGDFNDPSKWRIGSPTGATASQAPISVDNVHFLNSTTGSTKCTVTINSNANCQNFTVSQSSLDSIDFVGINTNITLDVYGSFELTTASDFQFGGILRFRSVKNGTEIIRSAGNRFLLNRIEFDGGSQTEWVLQDDFWVDDFMEEDDNWSWTIPIGSIVLYNGRINSNSQAITTDFFYSTNNSVNRGLILDHSTIRLRGLNQGTSKAWWIDFDGSIQNFNTFSVQETHFIFDQVIGGDQYSYFGKSLTYDSITTHSHINVEGDINCHFVNFQGSANFVDTRFRVDDLMLSNEKDYSFTNNHNYSLLEVDSIFSSNGCSEFITIRGKGKMRGLIRKKTPGELVLSQMILENMDCDITGGRTYKVIQGINGGSNDANWNFVSVTGKMMRFVDSGDHLWSNPQNWQVLNNGAWGSNTQGCIPRPFDDVIIDGSSFPMPTKHIIIDINAYCKSMQWEVSIVNNATFILQNTFHIFGKVVFDSKMASPTGGYPIYLHGQGDTITTNGLVLGELIFWKYSDYLLADNLIVSQLRGWLYSTLRAYNITIQTDVLTLGNRILDNVNIELLGNYYDYGGTTISYLGSTTFNFMGTSGSVDIRTQKDYPYSTPVYLPNVYGWGVRLQFVGTLNIIMGDVESLGDIEFRANSTQITGTMTNYNGQLRLHIGRNCELRNLYVADSIIAEGDCNTQITIRPYQGNTGLLEVGGAQVSNCFIQGINNTGLAINAFGCIDGGGNNGWLFSPDLPKTYYWRANAANPNDFTGNWSDPSHWTTDSASLVGVAGGCVPTLSDSVIFDNLSFSSNSNGCNIDQTAFCKTFVCRADIRITGNELYIAGSLDLYNNMTHFVLRGTIYFVGEGNNTINPNGSLIKSCGIVFDNELGTWELLDDFYLHDEASGCYTGFVLDAGIFKTNGHEVTIRSRFKAYRTSKFRVLDIRNSTVNLLCNGAYSSYYGWTWDISNSTGMQILSENSTVNFQENSVNANFTKVFVMGDDLTYDKVHFKDYNNQSVVHSDANYTFAYFYGTTIVNGSNTFDSLRLTGGHHWYLKSGTTQELTEEHGLIIADGNASDFVYIESTLAGQDAYIHKEYGESFCVDYVKIKDIQATKGLFDPVNASRHQILYFNTGQNSDNINGSASGIWRFQLPPVQTVSISHDPIFNFCNGGDSLLIPIDLTGTYPYSIIVTWSDDLGQSGVDTFYFDDDDNDVNTVYQGMLTLRPLANTNYQIDAAGLRCGDRDFNAPISFLAATVPTGVLVEQESHGSCVLTNQPTWTHFFDDQTVRPIVSIKDKKDSTDTVALGQVDVHAYFDTQLEYWQGEPYLPRHWVMESTDSERGSIRLYIDKSELQQLAAHYGTYWGYVLGYMEIFRFEDTITVGAASAPIPYSILPLTGSQTDPFSSTIDVIGIEIETDDLGAFLLRLNNVPEMLSLNILSFDATVQDDQTVQLDWVTKAEEELAYYIVERSRDGINFEEIDKKLAKNQPNNTYSSVDENPNYTLLYYRLKIVEKNGAVSYSTLKAVELEKLKHSLNIYPNPADEQMMISMDSEVDTRLHISGYDALGNLFMQREYPINQGMNQIELDTKQWPTGVSLFKMCTPNKQCYTRKVVIVH
ncbi:MAG: T9SS type A sorting domain-containing protein [Saprospiraceae bacterium]|nr:T9SS type A sorting domain-containing protein [Saprospiraceae bacterium]